ncbi:MAG: CFI-box-CTERM domain-containing protein [Erythrobacter sp.]
MPSFLSDTIFAGGGQDIQVDLYRKGSIVRGQPDQRFIFTAKTLRRAIAIANSNFPKLQERERRGQCKAQNPNCFLTTAASDLLNKPDNCWELTQLRRFRDHWLADQIGGPEQIAEYYERAPAIAKRLQEQPKRLARLYLTHILPSAIAARLGLNRSARWLYVRMMHTVSDVG